MEGSDADEEDDGLGGSSTESDEDAWQDLDADADGAAAAAAAGGGGGGGGGAAAAAPKSVQQPKAPRVRVRPPGRTPTPVPGGGAFAALAAQRRPVEPLAVGEVSGWGWLRRGHERADGALVLPPRMARRLARRGGAAPPGPGVRFKKREPHGPILTRRLRWVASTLRAKGVPGLALQLRQLHAAVRWDAIRRPPPGAPPPPPPPAGSAAATDAQIAAEAAAAAGVPAPDAPQWQGAAVRGKRGARLPRGGFEYLVGLPAKEAPGGHGHHHPRGARSSHEEPTVGSLLTSEPQPGGGAPC
jgi:hypothetical protein